jgi:Fe-S-cluster containining protein
MNSLREGLLAIYDELAVDIARAAPVCELSGRCCRFKEYGHTLFLSRPEAELLLEQGLPANAVVDEAGCPFQTNGLCTARERRPLGCRVYFCDPNYVGIGEQLSERYVTRLKQLHDQSRTAWDYRPLHRFLRDAEAGFGHGATAKLPISR